MRDRSRRETLKLFNVSLIFSAFILLAMYSCHSDKGGDKTSVKAPKADLPPSNGELFQVITKAAGINFVRTIGDAHLSNLVESDGGGAAFLDYDQDGYIDLYVSNGNYNKILSRNEKEADIKDSENHLYHNLGNGTFEDVTKKSKTGDRGYGMGVTVGDFNNDGYPDIYVSNFGPNVLFENKGDGTFKNITQKAGVGGDACSVGAVWLDYDKDGYLDLYVGNYIDFDPKYNYYYAPDGFPGPMAYDGQADVLYHNNGDGTFTDVTKKMNVYNTDGRAMGVGAADYDNDGWVDIFVSNDHMVNYLYHNNQGKGFEDRGISSGTAFNQVGEATISMSVAFADYNNDGLMDLFVSDNAYCSLHENKGNGVFSEMSYKAGIAVACGQFVGWASSFQDFDNDGDRDLFKVNGELKHLYGQEDQYFENQGDGTFKDMSTDVSSYFEEEHVGRGACFGDYDNDGDIDVFIVNLEEPSILLRNNEDGKNNWITFLLVGDKGDNRDAIGARITLHAGGKKQYTQKMSSGGYLSTNDPRIHFGLGQAKVVDTLEIVWPSGKKQILKNLKANQILTIKEAEAVQP